MSRDGDKVMSAQRQHKQDRRDAKPAPFGSGSPRKLVLFTERKKAKGK